MATAAIEISSERRSMAAAFLKTGGGSIASGLLSALAVKVVAVTMGAAGVAMLATLQQVMQIGLTGATLNGQTAMVQGASALAGARRRDFLTTSAWLVALSTMLTVLILFAAAGSRRWIAGAVALSAGFTFLGALLRARGEVGWLALIQVAAGAAYVLAALATRSLIVILTIPAASALGCAAVRVARSHEEIAGWFSGQLTCPAVRHFFKISGAMLATSLLATAVLLAVRVRITAGAGLEATGHFDAAWNISMNHVTVMLAAMQIYYLPALARARDASERARQMRGVMEIAILAAAAIVCGIGLARGWVIGLLYTRAFAPAAGLLGWTLIGDYLKVTSWVLAIPMLAAAEMRWFVATDTAVQVAFFAFARMLGGARGAAIGFAISYLLNFALCSIYARRRQGFRFGAKLGWMWMGGLAAVVGACR